MQLVDSHCHLNFSDFAEDFDEVIARASEAGVGVMQTICTRISEFATIHAIARAHEHIYCSVGVHPCNVQDEPLPDIEELLIHTTKPKVIGIGETGLDYYHDKGESRALQIESFRRHISVSRATGLPVIVHTRDADEDTVAILREEQQEGKFPFLIHCFTSTQWLAEEAMKLGGYISLSGIVTFKNAKEIQATAKTLPLDRILVETDAPYLAPMPHRGKRNEPAFTRHTAEFLANLRGEPFGEFATATTKNFHRLFNVQNCTC